MEQFECEKCGMAVKGLTCAKCGKELEHKVLDKESGKVGVCACPNGCGQIKSPQCCGKDMELRTGT